MPLQTIDTLLKDLSFVLPNVSVKDIDLRELMTFNVHNLQEQFQTDLIYASFFSMLRVETKRRLHEEEAAFEEYEARLSERIYADEQPTAARLKNLVKLDPEYRSRQNQIRQLEYQLSAVESVSADLQRKSIALNVYTAKTRAEIGAGLNH